VTLAAVIVAATALLFSIASFWWINARRGKVVVPEPHAFVLAGKDSTVLILRFPLVLFNSGAVANVIRGLQLRLPGEGHSVLPLPWRGTYNTLAGGPQSERRYATPFAVPARDAVPLIVEFGGPYPGFEMVPDQSYSVRIEGLLVQREGSVARCWRSITHKRSWQTLVDFDLPIPPKPWHQLAVHPLTQDQETEEQAGRFLDELLQELQARREAQAPPTD
jgi:hypothetical protein